jgi:CheY-like chemotaxis protein
LAKILVIDDETSIVMVLKEVLSDGGHEVYTAPNGLTGLELLKQGIIPDLLIIDLLMPGMGGRDFIKRIQSDFNLPNLAVILITGTIPDGDNFPPGGSYQDIICKPFDLDNVVEKVDYLLQKTQTSGLNPMTQFQSL